MITRVLVLCAIAFAIGGVGLYWASRKTDVGTRRARWIKFATYVCIVHLVLLCAVLGHLALTTLFAVIVLIGAFELYRVLSLGSGAGFVVSGVCGVVYLVFGAGLLAFALMSAPEVTVFVYLVVAAFDGFSQVAGQMLGQRRLAAEVSPGKTVEGAVGGLAAAAAMALLLRFLVHLGAAQSLEICAVVVLAGLSGDLLASWVKRRTGVKDFGSILPGHGGVLDRFDSLLVAAPISFVFLNHLK